MSVLVCLVAPMVPASADVISIPIANILDDAEEVLAHLPPDGDELGKVDRSSSDIELGQEHVSDEFFEENQNPYLVGLRFLDILIEPGATITSATIQFTVDSDAKDDREATVIVTGELNPNPVTYGGDPFDISMRPETVGSVDWAIPSWIGQVGVSGPDQNSPNLAAIVQELVDQAGWASGNAMAIMFRASKLDGTEGVREAESFNGSPTQAPVLTIDFTPSAGLAGDFDGDGDADGADLLFWQRDTNVGNLADWEADFGLVALSAVAAAVPEPATAILLVLATLGLLGARDRR